MATPETEPRQETKNMNAMDPVRNIRRPSGLATSSSPSDRLSRRDEAIPAPVVGVAFLRPFLAAIVLFVTTAFPATAARIAEPGTTLFGTITEQVGSQSFPVTGGTLVWRVRTVGPGGREHRLTTPVQPFGPESGRMTYRLTLPHELLSYDLSVRSNALAVGASSTKVEHLSVTLDGKPLTLAPIVASGFQIDQTRRAGTQRIDLTLRVVGQDSDEDGFPDDWEDANGYDKWNPADAPTGGSGGNGGSTGSQARNFSEWRTAFFPGQSSNLDLFGEQDSDGDGIANLFEYAFDLDPTKPDAAGAVALSLPHSIAQGGRQGIGFKRRSQATDIEFQVDSSPDLFTWFDATENLQPGAPSTPDDGRTLLVEKSVPADDAVQFFRVVVRRR
jgi:hypothetical protein